MRENIEQRACELAVYIIETHATVRIDGPQGPLRAAAALEPRALSAGQGGDGAEQGGAPHPRRHGHAPKISRGLRRFLAKRAYLWYDDTKKNKPQRGCGEGAAR